MALRNDPLRDLEKEEWAKRVKENPLLGMGLGELVAELYKICALDHYVIKPKNEIPKKSLSNYKKYKSIVEELNNREKKYKRDHNPIIY